MSNADHAVQEQAAPVQLYLSIYLPGVAVSKMVLESALCAALSVLAEQQVSLAQAYLHALRQQPVEVARAFADAREAAMSICGLDGFRGTFDLEVLDCVAAGQIAVAGR